MDIYKQKYEQALSHAKKELQACGSTDCDAYRQIIRLFPELKESEDERIREELIDFLKSPFVNENITDEKTTPWISWLEKQVAVNKRIQEEIEKQTKQQWKPEKRGDNVSGECNDTALEEQLKIWFEKGKCSGIDDVIFHPQKYGLEKASEQKPTWSEEDESMWLSAIEYVQTYPAYRKSVVHWLKSLKERYTWKPSDAQMKQLGWVAEQNKDNMIGKELMTLYNDLKKLIEE